MSKQGENTDKRNVLSLENLQEKHKQEFKMVENHVTLDDELLSYKMYERFPQSMKNDYIKDLVEFAYDVVMNEDYKDLEDSITVYSIILIIDKFTDLEIPQDYREKILYSELLADFGVLEPILMSFEEEEVNTMLQQAEQVMLSQTAKLENVLENYKSESEDIDGMTALRLVDKELESEGNGE